MAAIGSRSTDPAAGTPLRSSRGPWRATGGSWLRSRFDGPPQRRLVDAQDRRAVARAELHAARQALEIVGRGALRQRHAELIAELEREMQVLVGKVEGEARLEVAAQRPLRQALEGVGIAAGAGYDLDQLLGVEAGRGGQHQCL